MDIIFEIILMMLEFIFSTLFEIVLQLIGELLIEMGIRSIGETKKIYGEHNKILAFIGYGLLGLIVGYASIIIMPNRLFPKAKYHGISLIISPFLTGFIMSWIGKIKQQKGKPTMKLDTFSYGFIFALGMASIRYYFIN